MAQRCARIASAIGSNSGTKRFGLLARVPGETASIGHPRGNGCTEAGTASNRSAPRSWSRKAICGTGAPGGADGRRSDGGSWALTSNEGGFLGAVRRIGLPAPSADARIRRRVVQSLREPGPLGAAVRARRAADALARRARFVLLRSGQSAQTALVARSLSSWASSVSINVFAPLRSRAFSRDRDLIVAF